MTTALAGREHVCERLLEAVERWKKGAGDVVIMSGESGMGKSALLEWLEASVKETIVRVDCRPPVGSFNVSTIQPLQPFGHAIERLYLQGEQTARKRLALNIGMSVLASIPIAGDLFYAVKAISQDVSEYKRETAALQQKKRAAVSECVDTLVRIAERTPFILLVDDGQWSDGQSVEVIRALTETISDVPLLIVWTVTPSVAQRSNLPMTNLLRSPSVVSRTIALGPIDTAQTASILAALLPSANITDALVKRLHDRSGGSPGILAEYVRYLQRTGRIDADGTFADDAIDEADIHLGDHPDTDTILRTVSEEDSTILSLCAAEGREFTAFLAAALTNTDVLSIIRTLRRIQRTTGMIRSIGMRTRYGIKTTAYEFTQSFAYTYFVHLPEYEERKALHQRIADILSREYAAAELDQVKDQLAGMIAAHSAEADDAVTTERMLTISAEAAVRMGADDVAAHIHQHLLPLYHTAYVASDGDEHPATDEASPSATGGAIQHPPVRDALRTIADMLIAGRGVDALSAAMTILAERSDALATGEQVTLLCLASRAAIAIDEYHDAFTFLARAEQIHNLSPRDRTTILNVRAAAAMQQQDMDVARTALHEAASLASELPAALQVLTLGNIVILLRRTGDPGIARYERHLRRLTSSLAWDGIRADLEL